MKKRKEAYTVQLDPEFVEKIDKLADKLELSRSQFLGNLIQIGYDDIVILDNLGLLKVGKTFIDLRDKYFSKIKEVKDKED
jgi:hypothetical protein